MQKKRSGMKNIKHNFNYQMCYLSQGVNNTNLILRLRRKLTNNVSAPYWEVKRFESHPLS